ncbi:TetR/AcrR family transcriptional regulator [Nocardia sp. NPDC048505]|uniref:TetR/AcrR family transcriptional regulator n=1 Tax=unclassified Nocardia TaxID=2637762 RepID=UPI00340F33AB
MATQSAAGTRLNRKGRETRQRLLDVAITCLAESSGEPLSANRVARAAGVSWGTLKHQFGDLDGLWAEVLLELTERSGANAPESWPVFHGSVRERVATMIEAIWTILGTPEGRAVETLRAGLPNEQIERESVFPRTAAAMAGYENAWLRAFEYSLADLPLDPLKVHRVRCLIPPALRGLNSERRLTPADEVASARAGLVEAIAAYLS